MAEMMRLECLRLAAEMTDDGDAAIELANRMWRFVFNGAHDTAETAH